MTRIHRAEIPHKALVEHNQIVPHLDLLRMGFNPDKEIIWWDDPIRKVRVLTQEKDE